MKAIAAFLGVLFIGFALHATPVCRGNTRINYQPVETRYQTGLLFKVGKCGEAPSFIFGTVHSDDPAIMQTAAAAFELLPHSRAAGFEYIEPENAAEITQKYLFLDPAGKQTLPELIGEKDFALLAPKLAQLVGVKPEIARNLKPWAAAVMLQYPAAVADGVVLDMRLQREASDQNIPLFGLETMEQQFQIFDSIPLPLQIEMLKESLHDNSIDDMNAQLLAAYQAEDLRRIQAISDKSFARIKNRELAAMLEARLLQQRNHHMVKNLRTPLRQGYQFVAVGALHLTGKDGLLRLLERKGYLVEPLPRRIPLPQ